MVPAPKSLGAGTLAQTLLVTARAHAADVALRADDGSLELTYEEALERIRAIAAGLRALGVRRGDAVGLMMANRAEFHLVDSAAMLLGAVPFSVYNTLPPEQVGYVMGDAGNRVAVCDAAHLATVLAARDHGARVERVVGVDGGGDLSLAQLAALGDPAELDLDAVAAQVRPDDVLTLIYTSGTTGPPKGVELTHHGMLEELRGMHAAIPIHEGGRAVSFLPSAHVADRLNSHYAAFMAYGSAVTSVADLRRVFDVVARVRPTVHGNVPRLWEKLAASLRARGVTTRSDGAEVRAELGFEQCEWLSTGAAPIAVDVLEFLDALGMRLCEVWGMSEASCVAITNRPGAWRPGSVGLPLHNAEIALADDGELLVRGPLVMRGYRNRPRLTAEAVDDDGWLRTGDVARVDDDGFFWLIDRKKELIINSAGKNMSPANIEAALKSAGPLIGQACVVGDGRPYNVALLVLDPEAAAGLDPADPAVLARVRAEVDAANARLARVEQVRRFALLAGEWRPGGDELTPTMKLRRRPIAEKYAATIAALYAQPQG
ncbi:MAG TPA: AMP-dependent synthetase/ligase [Solirubrobacteraceae bacterium]|nr:AMP-dependent synthetase/ligase [Solirubrobacteraceae bacterium]